MKRLNYERAETINKDEIHTHLVMLIIKIITKLFSQDLVWKVRLLC